MEPKLVSQFPSFFTRLILVLAFVATVVVIGASLTTSIFNDPKINRVVWWLILIVALSVIGYWLRISFTAPHPVYCDSNFFYWNRGNIGKQLAHENIKYALYDYATQALMIGYRDENNKARSLIFFIGHSRSQSRMDAILLMRRWIEAKNPKAWKWWSLLS